MKIEIIKLKDGVQIPHRAHYNDAGLDCYALEDVTLIPMSRPRRDDDNLDSFKMVQISWAQIIPLGFGLKIPDGYMAVLKPRSSMNAKGIITQIGTIDSGYNGEIKAVLCNLNPYPVEIKKGERVCQLVIEPVVIAEFVEKLGDDRGDGGFGSTGQ